jgi:hypothetical protein
MSKQTAIDWLIKELTILNMLHIKGKIDTSHMVNRKNEIIAKAKEMEREQIEAAYIEGQSLMAKSVTNSMIKANSESYYEETYGGNNEQ